MVISRVIIRVTPFRALITLLIVLYLIKINRALITLLTTYLLSPLPLQVGKRFGSAGSGSGPH